MLRWINYNTTKVRIQNVEICLKTRTTILDDISPLVQVPLISIRVSNDGLRQSGLGCPVFCPAYTWLGE